MYEKLDIITLRDGEKVEAGVVKGPDAEWAPRLEPLLRHKGEPWNWQVTQVLTRQLDLEPYFYILHRNGDPFANIMTVEAAGVGVFGHVYTEPADRRKGASSQLMALQMSHFAHREGKALFLGTDYNSVAYKMYQRFGFESLEPQDGYMAYYATTEAQFNAEFYAPVSVAIEPLSWAHWPAMQPLFTGSWPGVVRFAAGGVNGRALIEQEPLPLIASNRVRLLAGEAPGSVVMRNCHSQAVVGFAALSSHPMWPEMDLLDMHCHPDYWGEASLLLALLDAPTDRQIVAYGDSSCERKIDFLTDRGFVVVSSLPNWVHADLACQIPADLLILARKST